MPKKPVRNSARQRDDYQVLVQLLGKVREEQEMTQVALAEALGKQQSWVAKAETGGRRVDVIELLAILDALGVNVSKFIQRLRDDLPARHSKARRGGRA